MLVTLFLFGIGTSAFAVKVAQTSGKAAVETIAGCYVSDSYAKRSQGYDWVAVIITKYDSHKYRISVRSRGDRKRPSCTFDAFGYVLDRNVLRVTEDGKTILFTVAGGGLTIATEQERDAVILSQCCSGGASLAGRYMKIKGAVDAAQIDKTVYRKYLTQDSISFAVEQMGNVLTIRPNGLSADSNPVSHKVDGKVVDAEVGDLNNDGYPEVMVYLRNKVGYGSVIGYSVNAGKSMSQITFTGIANRKELKKGYFGKDDFAIVESTFCQRFPLFSDGKTRINLGKTRQVQYKLKNGEASRVLAIDRVVEY